MMEKKFYKSRKNLILILILSIAIVSSILIFSAVSKSITEISGISNNSLESDLVSIDENDIKTYGVYMIINELDTALGEKIDGNIVKITSNSTDLSIKYMDKYTDEEVGLNEDGSVTIPSSGVKLRIDGIKEGNRYQLYINNIETANGYSQTFKSATVEINAIEPNQITSSVVSITKIENDEEVTTSGSDKDSAIFMYENDNGKIIIRGKNDASIYYVVAGNDGLTEQELEDATWELYNKDKGIDFEKNGMLYSKSFYKTGEYSEITSIKINSVDKLLPSVEVVNIQEVETHDEAIISIVMKDQAENDDYGMSGIYGYAITRNQEEPNDFIESEEEVDVSGITSNGTYYIWVSDKAGNINHISIEVDVITAIEEAVEAIVLKSSVSELVGKEYKSLTTLLDELESYNVTDTDEQTVIQLVKSIKNESIVINNKNILLDLNGYQFGATLQEPAVKVQSGLFTVVDNKYQIEDYIEDSTLATELKLKYSSLENNGKIYCPNYIAIEILEGATATIGEDDILGYPDKETPIIEGYLKGILNFGTFNYYDGIIIGKSIIDGKISNTPLSYKTVIVENDNERYQATLEKIIDAEALIGSKSFITLEKAISYVNNLKDKDGSQIEIDVINNITKISNCVINSDSNILIDLNGYRINNNSDTLCTFENHGILSITDSRYGIGDQFGKLIGSYKIISNSGSFKLDNGIIESIGKTPAIENIDGGTITISGGIIKCSNTSSEENSAICNVSGNVYIDGGTVQGYCGINNKSEGTVTVNGGSITDVSYGIYNIQGEVIYLDGTINNESEEIVLIAGIYNEGGNVTVSGGTICGNTGIQNENSGVVTIENGTINGSIYGINIGTASNVIVNDGTIIGGTYGIYNRADGTVQVENGTIYASSENVSVIYGMYNNGTGSIILGNNKSKSLNEINVYAVTSDQKYKGYGIYNKSGIFEFYNGKITGSYASIEGIVTKVLIDNCIKNTNTEIGIESVLVSKYGVAYIEGSEDEVYTSVKNAIENAQNNDKIILVEDSIAIEDEQCVIDENKSITIDLNGKNLTYYSSVALTNNGTLLIEDSSQDKLGVIYSSYKCVDNKGNFSLVSGNLVSSLSTGIYNEGNVEVEGGTITGAEISGKDSCGINNISGNIILNNGTIYGYYAIYNFSDGELTINNAELSAKYANIYNYDLGNVTINDVKISKGNYGVYNFYDGNITIKNAIMSNVSYGIYANGNSKIDIDYIEITDASVGISNAESSIITINNAKIIAIEHAVYNQSSSKDSNGKIIIYDGTFISTNNDIKLLSSGIYNAGYGFLEIYGGTFEGVIGIYNSSKNKVIVKDTVITGITYGIRNTKTSNMELTNLNITGSKYGIHDITGSINMIDCNVSSENYAFYCNGSAEIYIKGGSLIGGKKSSYSGVYNTLGNITLDSVNISGVRGIYNGSGTITIDKSNISDSTIGIYNFEDGEIFIKSVYINVSNTGIYNNGSGIITIGVKDEILENDLISVKGTLKGLFNSQVGKVYFYDGTVVGSESIDGIILDTEKGYSVSKYKNGETDNYEIEDGMELAVLEKLNILKLQSTNKEYVSLKEALNECSDIDKITLLLDCNITDDEIIIDETKSITIDLAGKELSKRNGIINNGILEIINSNDEKNGRISGETFAIQNNGTLLLNSEKIDIQTTNEGIVNYGTITVKCGKIVAGTIGIKNIEASSEIIFEAGTIEANEYGIYNSFGNVTIKNGTIQGGLVNNYAFSGIYNEHGNVQIDNCTLNGVNGLLNTNYGQVLINNANINGSVNGVYNIDDSIITIESGSITGNVGILNETNGEVIVKDVIITATEYGIKNIETGSITLGIQDLDISLLPSIQGTEVGLSNSIEGKVYYYDGIINGAEGSSTLGIITNTEDGFNIIKYKNGQTDDYEIDENREITVLGMFDAIYLESTNKKYSTLKQALEEINENDRIQLLSNVYVIANDGEIGLNGSIVLDLNGNNLNVLDGIKNTGMLEIIDSSEEKNGTIQGELTAINNYGTLTLTSGTIIAKNDAIALTNKNSGIININGGNINAANIGIYNESNATANINGGDIFANIQAIYNNENAILNINNGNVRGLSVAVYNKGGNTIINGGSLTGKDGLKNEGTGEVLINNVTITGTENGIYHSGARKIIIKDGNISGLHYGIYNYSVGEINIEGGTIVGSEDAISTYSGVYNNATGKITVKGGTINGYRGIYNYEDGDITMDGGKIEVQYCGIYSRTKKGSVYVKSGTIKANRYGIYCSNGNLTVGDSDSQIPSKTNPSIMGETYGINVGTSCILSLYGGRIYGGVTPIFGSITNVPEGYEKSIDENNVLTLEASGTFGKIIETNDSFFDSLKAAVESITSSTNKTGIIKIWDEVTTDEVITIPADADITIILSGHSIVFSKSGVAITNNGTLRIIDFEDDSEIGEIPATMENTLGILINNNGTVILGKEDSSSNYSPKIIGTIAVYGNDPIVYSGEIVNTEENTLISKETITNENITFVNGIKRAFLNSVNKALRLASAPEITILTEGWSNDAIHLEIMSSIVGQLNLISQNNEYEYTVHYFYEGIEDESKTETKTGLFATTITEFEDKNIKGYQLDTTNGIPKVTITTNPEENVMNVYYVKKDYKYTINYYRDDELYQTTEKKAKYETEFSDVTIINIEGYRVMNDEESLVSGIAGIDNGKVGLPLIISDNEEENVVDIYYVKDDFEYRVEYYYNEILNPDKTEIGKAKYLDIITDYIDKGDDSLTLSRIEGLPLTISAYPDRNVIKIFYEKDKYRYYVEYLYEVDEIVDENNQKQYVFEENEEEKETNYAPLDSNIETIEDKEVEGYTLLKVEGLPLTVSIKEEENVIRKYYTKNFYNYTVNYFYDGIEAPEKVSVLNAKYKDVIEDVENKCITGYKLEKIETLPITISLDETQNIINVYYVKDEFEYTVNYFYEESEDENKEIIYKEDESKRFVGIATYQDVISNYEDKVIEKYELANVVGIPLTISENPENNKINVYYKKLRYEYTVEYYYEDKPELDKSNKFIEIIDTEISNYPDECITGYKFDRHENIPMVVSSNVEENIIKVYYVKDEFEYTVKYFYEESENENNEIEYKEDESKREVSKVKFETVINDYIDKNITGYKFEKTDKLPLTVSEKIEENIISVYYIKENFDYTVKYFYEESENEDQEIIYKEDESKREIISVKYGTIITEVTDKVITGFEEDKIENLPLTVREISENNIINVYYKKQFFDYTIKYFYEESENENNEIEYKEDESKREIISVKYGTVITEVDDKIITGYTKEKTEGLPLTVSEVSENNIISVYYIKANFEYEVHYFYEESENENNEIEYKEDESKKEVFNAKFGTVIQNVPEKNITGYKLKNVDKLPLIVSEVSENNIINVYYIKDSFEYTIRYLCEDKEISDTEVSYIEKEELRITLKIKYASVVEEYESKDITGFRFEKVENIPLIITEKPENNIINVYYLKEKFEYSVHYFYEESESDDGKVNFKEDTEKLEIATAKYGTEISDYTDKVIKGYIFDKTENLPLTVSEKTENNIINVYYLKNYYKYTVHYFYELGVDSENNILYTEDTEKIEEKTEKYEALVTDVADKVITGYVIEKTEGLPLAISDEEELNVVNIYYKKDYFEYTVRYLYEDEEISETEISYVEKEELRETLKEKFGTIIDTYTQKNIPGYKFDKTENLPLTISEKPENNIINVYYVKDYFKYTVHYLYEESESANNEIQYKEDIDKKDEIIVKFNTIITEVTDKVITGFEEEKIENLPLTVSENEESNVINVYYKKSYFEYTVKYFYNGEEDISKKDTFNVKFGTIISEYTDKNIKGYEFSDVENLPLTVSENPESNVIAVYYVTKQYNYIVRYLCEDGMISDTEVKYTEKEELRENLKEKFESVITEYPNKEIPGYKLIDVENLPLTISDDEKLNIINVYYAKEIYEYTVHYFYEDIENTEKLEKQYASYGTVIEEYLDKCINGYVLEKTENLPLIVSENVSNNVINVYYVKTNVNYVVRYFYDDVEDINKAEVLSARLDSIVKDYPDKNIIGYKLEKTENLPLTISENVEENVINVYYTKDEFEYTVHYFYEGTEDNEKSEIYSGLFGTVIDEYNDKNITGYKFDKVENLPLTISENVEENVINVYYIKDEFEYTVHYFYNNVEDIAKVETNKAKYGTEITTYIDKIIPGYMFDSMTSLTVSEKTEENIMNVYYVTEKYEYEVHYFYDGIEDISELEKVAAYYGDEIEQYTDKCKEGYRLDYVENLPLIISDEAENNVINVYYVKIPAKVIVKYLDVDTDNELAEEVVISGFVGDEYKTEQKDISGYVFRENTNNTEGLMTEETINVIYYYSEFASVIVNYIDNETEEIIDKIIFEGKVGDEFTSEAKEISKYTLVKTPENETVILTKETITLNYYYVYTGPRVIEKHIDFVSNEVLYMDTILGEENDKYEINPKTFDGYELITNERFYSKDEKMLVLSTEELNDKYIPENYSGYMTNTTIEVVYYYIKTVSVKVEYINQFTKEIIDTEIINGFEGDSYETSEKTFEDYDLVSEKYPENAKGTMEITKDEENKDITEILVSYYYAHKAQVIEKHIDKVTGNVLFEEEHKGHEGDEYETTSREFEDFVLVVNPENRKGIMKISETIVEFYYAHISKGVIEKHIDIDTEKVLEEKIHTGNEGDGYEIFAKEFAGYNVVTEKYPENRKGTMTIDEIVVTFYYKVKPVDDNQNNNDSKDETKDETKVEEIKPIVKEEPAKNTNNVTIEKKEEVKDYTPNNTNNEVLNTGDKAPLIAFEVIFMVVGLNIVQIILNKRKKFNK